MDNVFGFRFQGTAKEYLKEFWGIEQSVASVVDCPLCHGKGSYAAANGEDDFDNTMCEGCSGTGKIVALNF